jgi:pimeloyl-ACP methyl ester carboxylesterase
VSDPTERSILVGDEQWRLWEKGEGEPLIFLGGLRGLPRWPQVLDLLATQRRVIAPSLPGFPGATGHDRLDDLADWVSATLDRIDGCDVGPCDLVGASVGGTLAAEVAAFSPALVKRLVLIAPFGLFDDLEPVADIWAKRLSEIPALLSAKPDALAEFLAKPDDVDEIDWQVLLARANEAAARLLWPTGDLGLRKRLRRIQAPTLLLWGGDDRVVPAGYAKRFAAGISGWVETTSIADAGHMAEIDQPGAVAEAILGFTG